ncbi:MAG: exosome complex protein Rrp42 [Candidatus Nanohaloarchaea archaeon]
MKLNTKTIREMASEGERLDGRDLDEYREIQVDKDYIPTTAQGSARVKIGDTQVIVGISFDAEEPYPDRPEAGTIVTNAELAPMADREYESGPPQEPGVELARVVDRGIRESEAIDLEALCIEEGEKVYTVFIDVHVLNNDGNLIDASALGAIAALQDGYVPAYSEEEGLQHEEVGMEEIPMNKIPVTATGRKIGDTILWDTTSEEEEALGSRVTVTLTEEDKVVAMQKGGRESTTAEEISQIIEEAKNQTQEFRDLLEE